MGVVDYTFYSTVYGGTDATQAQFPALCARASDVIGAMTHWVDDAKILTLPALIQTLYKKAVCAQVDFFAIICSYSLFCVTIVVVALVGLVFYLDCAV